MNTELLKQIEKEAKELSIKESDRTEGICNNEEVRFLLGVRDSYITGATAYAGKAEKLLEALEGIKKLSLGWDEPDIEEINATTKAALSQYRANN